MHIVDLLPCFCQVLVKLALDQAGDLELMHGEAACPPHILFRILVSALRQISIGDRTAEQESVLVAQVAEILRGVEGTLRVVFVHVGD